MKPPAFWNTRASEPSWQARLLSPLGALYASVTAKRVAKLGYKASVPVICVGNINAGGTGKTPTAMALVGLLLERGHTPHIVSRGYGGSLEGPVQVASHSASEVGDEPLLLSSFAPTWVAKDRKAGVIAAQAAGATVILLDDGFQNAAVQKDLSIVVVDALQGFGNGRVLPAGPLREPVQAGLKRADLVLSLGNPTAQERFLSDWGHTLGTVPHATGEVHPLPTGMPWNALRLMAFAGIGNPEKFFTTLRGLGADLIATESLSDHQPLTEALLARLAHDAKAQNAQLVTTEKDAVRLPHNWRGKVLVLPVRLAFHDQAPLLNALEKAGL